MDSLCWTTRRWRDCLEIKRWKDIHQVGKCCWEMHCFISCKVSWWCEWFNGESLGSLPSLHLQDLKDLNPIGFSRITLWGMGGGNESKIRHRWDTEVLSSESFANKPLLEVMALCGNPWTPEVPGDGGQLYLFCTSWWGPGSKSTLKTPKSFSSGPVPSAISEESRSFWRGKKKRLLSAGSKSVYRISLSSNSKIGDLALQRDPSPS